MKTTILSFIAIVFVLLVCNCVPVAEDHYDRVEYELEYDNQVSADLIGAVGESNFTKKTAFAFDRNEDGARTFTHYFADNSSTLGKPLDDDDLFFNELGSYTVSNRQVEGGVSVLPAYVVIVKNVVDAQNIDGASVTGPEGWSVVFWDQCESDDHRMKVLIHELGHQRTTLTHLCEDRSNHDRDDCVMGQGIISPCTGKNLINTPRFCPKDELKLRDITW